LGELSFVVDLPAAAMTFKFSGSIAFGGRVHAPSSLDDIYPTFRRRSSEINRQGATDAAMSTTCGNSPGNRLCPSGSCHGFLHKR
jgi:hypothetical protein